MRKLALLLSLIIITAVSFTACGDDEKNNNDNNTPTQEINANGNSITTLTVTGMTCGRCERAITDGLSDLDGVIGVTADFATNSVIIEHTDEIDFAQVKDVLELDLGFDVEGGI